MVVKQLLDGAGTESSRADGLGSVNLTVSSGACRLGTPLVGLSARALCDRKSVLLPTHWTSRPNGAVGVDPICVMAQNLRAEPRLS